MFSGQIHYAFVEEGRSAETPFNENASSALASTDEEFVGI